MPAAQPEIRELSHADALAGAQPLPVIEGAIAVARQAEPAAQPAVLAALAVRVADAPAKAATCALS